MPTFRQIFEWCKRVLGKRALYVWQNSPKLLAWIITILTIFFVGMELRQNWRQAQLTYLQTRSQDFLRQEYETPESLGCIYDWWFIGDERVSAEERLLERCEQVLSNPEVYAETMLYMEEVLMYFVEESRIACTNGVSIGRELDIWRNDMREDRSGLVSFYILSRFGDPNLAYYSDLYLPTEAPSARVSSYIRQARLPGITMVGLCDRALRFHSMLQFPVELPQHVVEMCRAPSDVPLFTDLSGSLKVTPAYCYTVLGVRRGPLRSIVEWVESITQ